MSGSRTAAQYVLDVLGAGSGFELGRFFGGWSLRYDGRQAGIVMDTVYVKVLPAHRDEWHAAGAHPFRYVRDHRTIYVEAYWSVPPEALDNPELLHTLLVTGRALLAPSA
ncbi:TfoX/Sxy family protein [Nocardia sp. NPDC050175]|uniref:TfoX/Sxy family protein n=1 Tax=Nocardia sp. NPDC050175 TaxID=3364317 RepID=UPI003797A060